MLRHHFSLPSFQIPPVPHDMSPAAVGLLCHLLTMVDGSPCSAPILQESLGLGRVALRRIVAELRQAGFLRITTGTTPRSTRRGGAVWHVYDSPLSASEAQLHAYD